MKRLLILMACVALLIMADDTQAKEDSLFPKADEVNTEKPSLDSAIAQFEGIIGNSTDGEIDSLKANDKYNQQRTRELEQQLTEKKKYIEAIPDIVSRQFETLMKQYADSDQKTKNKMADDLYAKWKIKEASVKQEIAEIEEQLTVSNKRLSESAVKGQMLQITNSLTKSEKALRYKTPEKTDPQAKSSAFQNMQELSRRRILSKIRGLCPIQVKPLDTELSIQYLDN